MGDLPFNDRDRTSVINGAEASCQSVSSFSWFITELLMISSERPCILVLLFQNRGAWLEYETDSNDVFYV